MARGEDKPNNDESKGLKPETIRWWDDRVEQLIAEQRGSDALPWQMSSSSPETEESSRTD